MADPIEPRRKRGRPRKNGARSSWNLRKTQERLVLFNQARVNYLRLSGRATATDSEVYDAALVALAHVPRKRD